VAKKSAAIPCNGGRKKKGTQVLLGVISSPRKSGSRDKKPQSNLPKPQGGGKGKERHFQGKQEK